MAVIDGILTAALHNIDVATYRTHAPDNHDFTQTVHVALGIKIDISRRRTNS